MFTGQSHQRGCKREAVGSSWPDSESVKPADPTHGSNQIRASGTTTVTRFALSSFAIAPCGISQFRTQFPLSPRTVWTFIRTRPNTIHLTSSGVSPSNGETASLSLSGSSPRFVALCSRASCRHQTRAINFNPRLFRVNR